MKVDMFQTFSEKSDPTKGPERVKALRALFENEKLDGFLIPRTDEYQSEFLPPSSERLAWLTGFTGSFGFAVVLQEKAAIFIDGRYTLQVRDQVDTNTFEPVNYTETTPWNWLGANAAPNTRIGFDPWLITQTDLRRFEKATRVSKVQFVAVTSNPIDQLWQDRPAPPKEPIEIHPLSLAGQKAEDKIASLQKTLQSKGRRRPHYHRPLLHSMAVQYSRSGYAPHPCPSGFRYSASRRQTNAVY
jgi:Xaa-Pro aminopeptidase